MSFRGPQFPYDGNTPSQVEWPDFDVTGARRTKGFAVFMPFFTWRDCSVKGYVFNIGSAGGAIYNFGVYDLRLKIVPGTKTGNVVPLTPNVNDRVALANPVQLKRGRYFVVASQNNDVVGGFSGAISNFIHTGKNTVEGYGLRSFDATTIPLPDSFPNGVVEWDNPAGAANFPVTFSPEFF